MVANQIDSHGVVGGFGGSAQIAVVVRRATRLPAAANLAATGDPRNHARAPLSDPPPGESSLNH